VGAVISYILAPLQNILINQNLNIIMVEKNAAAPAGNNAELTEIIKLIVEALNLEMSADEIDPDAPLYGDGLGLDSIDILEVALVISKRYGLQLKADNEDNYRIFSSMRSLADYVVAHKTNP
jgi:acyl carrier protein